MDLDQFITRWTESAGGAERANYQMFLTELCDALGVARPDPAGPERRLNDYVFERGVRRRESEGVNAVKRIDLYKRDCFILEAKQSQQEKRPAGPSQGALFGEAPAPERDTSRGWDVMMQRARRQAEDYVHLLETDHAAPPFMLICDVGHCIEVYADFSGTGRGYTQFPDRQGFRIFLKDLRRPEIRERLAAIWTDPHSLDPARKSARVTREIAGRLAEVSKALEKDHAPQEVAHFLMRCIFTMFAEDVDLLPKGAFTGLLEDCVESPPSFQPLLNELWAKMDEPDHDKRFFSAFKTHLKHFNGNLFRDARAFPLERAEIGELLQAAKCEWTEADPAIFGTLLEQALDSKERKQLGAHYTPRAYVQRLVDVTIMELLRADWQAALTKAEDAKERGKDEEAIQIVRDFHHALCATRVLDPACGTGNFLYVSLELMKRLEGEVLETLAKLGVPEKLALERETVDPHQFLGLELNPRAAAIAELVIWIGYLQQHYRTRGGHPSEPILRAFRNINFGRPGGYDAVLTWDGYPVPKIVDGKETYPNARKPEWPDAEFIVGNPPFIGNKRMRNRLGDAYVEALRSAYPSVNEGVDLVMYWWDRAAELPGGRSSVCRRFGLVTTNSITQTFNRRVVEHHLRKKNPLSLVVAFPDHPWTKADRTSAAVRIAMTVAQQGRHFGMLGLVEAESGLDTDEPSIRVKLRLGTLNANLQLGADVSQATELMSNADLAHQGIIPVGEGFRIDRKELESLGYDVSMLPPVVRRYAIGRDLVGTFEERFIIDFFGMTNAEARSAYPRLFQIIIERVKPQRDEVNRAKTRTNYWIYAEPRSRMRAALATLPRYIVTCRTAKHRIFSFLDGDFLADAKIIAIALSESDFLALLSSRVHLLWALKSGAWLGVGNDSNYNHSECFAKFPFPDPPEDLKAKLRALGEELDATRKRVQAEHPDLTLTGIYNVLEKLRATSAPSTASRDQPSVDRLGRSSLETHASRSLREPALTPSPVNGGGSAPSVRDADTSPAGGGGIPLTDKEEDIKQRGLVLILKELHDKIDALTFEAYGWPADLTDEQILERLVALNAERAKEEAAGKVRWLRPDYQIPRFGKAARAETAELDVGEATAAAEGKPAFPKDATEQPLAVLAALSALGAPADAAALARAFKAPGRSRAQTEARIGQVLTTLERYGRVRMLDDGRFALPRAA